MLGQTEHLPAIHPVYTFLQHAEAMGLLEHFSLSALPLQRGQVINALRSIRAASGRLSTAELHTLELYERELLPEKRYNAALISASNMPVMDTASFFFDGFFSQKEKGIYFHADSNANVYIVPLASTELTGQKTEGNGKGRSMFIVQGGGRIHGTIGGKGGSLGYFLQATNGSLLSGDRALALEDPRLRQNIKFAVLNSDFDITESHVRYDNDWFYVGLGRETRLLGAGFNHHVFLGRNSPPLDALMAGVRFPTFEYRFTHAALLALGEKNGLPVRSAAFPVAGSDLFIPAKTLVMHRAAFRPAWGEIAIWESIIYQNRSFDLAYMNPFSFLKSIEHSLRDRDNSALGADFTIRPVSNLVIKGTYLLDDIIFSRIGTDYWGNKAAFSLGGMYTLPWSLNVGMEYARVYPYTFSHFNVQNSMTSDGQIITGSLRPNSDELSLMANWWWGNRYPLQLLIAFQRHGANEMITVNGVDSVVVNHGGDALYARNWATDSENAPFLAGIRENTFKVQVAAGAEIWRGFNVQAVYQFRNTNGIVFHTGNIAFRFEDF